MTKAESEIAIGLVNGLALSEIADGRNVSVATVRSQLKSICSKMNVNRQQDIIRVLLQNIAPLS